MVVYFQELGEDTPFPNLYEEPSETPSRQILFFFRLLSLLRRRDSASCRYEACSFQALKHFTSRHCNEQIYLLPPTSTSPLSTHNSIAYFRPITLDLPEMLECLILLSTIFSFMHQPCTDTENVWMVCVSCCVLLSGGPIQIHSSGPKRATGSLTFARISTNE